MNTCSFTYVPLRTQLPCRVIGIERTWEYLSQEFNRQGENLTGPNVKYFETIGHGPLLFAVDGDSVFYNDQRRWFKYHSAFDIVHGTLEIPD